MKIYMTGIGATPYAREYLSKFGASLRAQGHQVFVAHENSWDTTPDAYEQNRFEAGASWLALSDSDWLVAVLDGYCVDDAVATQIGMFYALCRTQDRPRRIIGVLHDSRIAGWNWTAGDRALSPQVRDCIRDFGEVVPSFSRARALLDLAREG